MYERTSINDAVYFFSIAILFFLFFGVIIGFLLGKWHETEKRSIETEKKEMAEFKQRIENVREKLSRQF
jgi:uncharacterized membrane-anchored protein YhcB (DUF1043 family)